MADDILNQAINYEIGFVDEATEGFSDIDHGFTQMEKGMDDMVNKFDDSANVLQDKSHEISESFDSVGNSTPDMSINESVGGDKEGGFFDKLGGMFKMFKSFLPSILKIVGAFSVLAAVIRPFAPMMELLGFFLEMVLEPFQYLFLDLAMQAKPIFNKLIAAGYNLADTVLPFMADAVRSFSSVVVNKIIPAVEDFTYKYLVPLVKWVFNAIKTFFEWEHSVEILAGALIGILAAPILAVVVPAIFSAIASLITFGVTLFTTVIPAIVGATAAAISFTIALLASPITWVVAGLALIGVGLWKLAGGWEGIKNIVMTVWDTITGFAKGLWELIKGPIMVAFKPLIMVWDIIKEKIFGVWDSVKGFFSGVKDKAKTALGWVPGLDFGKETKNPKVSDIDKTRGKGGEDTFSKLFDMKDVSMPQMPEVGMVKSEKVKTTYLPEMETVKPQIPKKGESTQKEMTQPLTKEIRMMADRIVRAINTKDLSVEKELSDELRKFGTFGVM